MNESSRKAMRIAPPWRWPGRWSPICWPWIAEKRTSFLQKGEARRRLKPPAAVEKRLQDYTARRLPGPAGGRLSEGDQTPEAPSNCFGTGREHKLNLL